MRYLYIAGKWTEAADDGTSQTLNPYDATVLDTLAEACVADVDAAVTAAREAFDGPWRRSTVTDRAALLGKIADLLQRDREQLAHTESLVGLLAALLALGQDMAGIDNATGQLFKLLGGRDTPPPEGPPADRRALHSPLLSEERGVRRSLRGAAGGRGFRG